MNRRDLLASASFGIASMVVGGPSYAQKGGAELKLAHNQTTSHSWHVAATGFAQEVEQLTEGRVRPVVMPSAQLGTDKEVLEGLQFGSVQMSVIGGNSFSSIEPKMQIVELPYAWPTIAHMHRALDGDLGSALARLLDQKGITLLSWWDLGTRHITNNKGPITRPDDLKGLKIRVTPDKLRIDTFHAIGAQPAPLSFGELYSALQQGVFDAQENPLEIIASSSFYEVQKYVSLTGHVTSNAALVASKATLNKLSEGDREHIKKAALKWRDEQRTLFAKRDADAKDILKTKGMISNDVDKAAFVAAMRPVWEQYERIFGKDLMDLVRRYGEA